MEIHRGLSYRRKVLPGAINGCDDLGRRLRDRLTSIEPEVGIRGAFVPLVNSSHVGGFAAGAHRVETLGVSIDTYVEGVSTNTSIKSPGANSSRAFRLSSANGEIRRDHR